MMMMTVMVVVVNVGGCRILISILIETPVEISN